MTGKRATHCHHCGGTLVTNYEERGCSLCGRLYQSIWERHAWYEFHRAEITADLRKIGQLTTVQKWRIGKNTICRLKHHWGLPVRRYHFIKHRKEGNDDHRRSHHNSPS